MPNKWIKETTTPTLSTFKNTGEKECVEDIRITTDSVTDRTKTVNIRVRAAENASDITIGELKTELTQCGFKHQKSAWITSGDLESTDYQSIAQFLLIVREYESMDDRDFIEMLEALGIWPEDIEDLTFIKPQGPILTSAQDLNITTDCHTMAHTPKSKARFFFGSPSEAINPHADQIDTPAPFTVG